MEDYTLNNVLSDVSRDDLRALRLRYPPCTITALSDSGTELYRTPPPLKPLNPPAASLTAAACSVASGGRSRGTERERGRGATSPATPDGNLIRCVLVFLSPNTPFAQNTTHPHKDATAHTHKHVTHTLHGKHIQTRHTHKIQLTQTQHTLKTRHTHTNTAHAQNTTHANRAHPQTRHQQKHTPHKNTPHTNSLHTHTPTSLPAVSSP